MKLFQQMLVAGASLSLIAPIAAQASDVVNIEEMNSYANSQTKSSRFDSTTFINEVSEDIANLKGRLDGLEAKQNVLEAGSFSDTTTLDGKAVFRVGALDAPDPLPSTLSEALMFTYMYQMNLNTSFTGDDNLYVRLKTGNATKDKTWAEKPYGTYLSSTNTKGDSLAVDKMWYTLPVNDNNTVYVGPKIENYYMHGTTPSIYKPILKQFTLGGNASAYGASTSPGAGWTYTADNGFAISSNFTTQYGNTNTGLVTNEGKTSWATQVGYTTNQWAVSAIANMKYNGWTDTYFSTATGGARKKSGNDSEVADRNKANSTNIGLRAWWRPQETGTATPSVSIGYDTSEIDGAADSASNTTMYFVGLTWQDMFSDDDRIGIALGQPQKNESETTDPFAWEAYYSFKVNDSVTVTPAVFGGSSRNGTDGQDVTGAVVETEFKF